MNLQAEATVYETAAFNQFRHTPKLCFKRYTTKALYCCISSNTTLSTRLHLSNGARGVSLKTELFHLFHYQIVKEHVVIQGLWFRQPT